jgi:hypothetical protein
VTAYDLPIRWLLVMTLALGLALIAFVLAYRFMPPIGSVSAKALSYSMALHFDGADIGSSNCHRQAERSFTCSVSNGSGGDQYRVTLHGRCWTATRAGGSARYGARAHGCVRWRDQLRIWQRLGL